MTESETNRSSLLNGLDHAPAAPTKRGKEGSIGVKPVAAAVFAFISVAVLSYLLWSAFVSYRDDPKRAAFLPTLMDAETGEVFEKYQVDRGENRPYLNPKTGKRNLYPVELCYWTKDGKAKFPPTMVILNEIKGVPGATICPDCGRRVTLYNSRPPDRLMQAAWDAAQKK